MLVQQKIKPILEKAIQGQDISPEEALQLLQQHEPKNIAAIRDTADRLCQKTHGSGVTYVVNRNLNFTNICEQHCSFCAFRRDTDTEGAFWLSSEQMLSKVQEAVKLGATEICIQGGLHPAAKINGKSLTYYQRLLDSIKSQFPSLHLHAFSPQEIQFIARQDSISYQDVILALKAVGLGSMPGTAAEILDDRVRKVICPEKIDSATWCEIVSLAHSLGVPTTSTMLTGHIETPQQQIAHLDQLRSLQQKAIQHNYPARISEFIILPFVGEQAPAPLRARVGRDQPVLSDTLLITAVARIFLHNWIPNHQPSWVKLGLKAAVEALNWGCNDLGGTLMEEHITTMAGAKGGTCLSVTELKSAIASIEKIPQQRTTLYQILENKLSEVKSPSRDSGKKLSN